jgi:hypothetical protein
MSVRLALILTVPVCLGACRTTEVSSPVAAEGEVRVASPARAWELHDQVGEAHGLVLYFQADGADEDSLYMVQNLWHQDLGLIDAYGRAYRYLPHHREPAWVGSGTVEQGAGRILGIIECSLIEVPFPDLGSRPATPGEHDRRRIETRMSFPTPNPPSEDEKGDSRPKPLVGAEGAEKELP